MNLQNNWEIYTSSWKAQTLDEKLDLFKLSLAVDCVYTDPIIQTKGWDELASYMLDFHQQIPGGHFVTSWYLSHHGQSIATWKMRSGDKNIVGEGISYGIYDADGFLTQMSGFFDLPPT